MRSSLAAALALLAVAPAFAADPARFMPAELIAETTAPRAGTTILVGFRMTPRPGWHGYWSNPGDSGIAPSVTWSAPKGGRFGPLLHPAPTLLSAGGINSYVHDGPHVLLSRMTIDRSVSAGTQIPVEAKLSWAACTETQCVPLHATFKLQLISGDGANGPESSALATAAARLPKNAPGGTFVAEGSERRLMLPRSIRIDPATARFFPDDNDAFVAVTGRTPVRNGSLVITGSARAAPSPINGIVSDGRSSYRISFAREPGAPSGSAPKPAKEDARPPLPATANAPAVASEARTPPRGVPPSQKRDWLPITLAGVLLFGAVAAGLRRVRRR